MSDINASPSAAAELDDLRQEVERLNAELEETNRGVLALYAELDDHAEQLRRVSEYKSRFLSVISHELRTPLTSVTNLARLLLDRMDGDLTPEQERQIIFIRDSVASLTEMVNELLDLAKIEAGKSTVTIERASVGTMLAGLRGVFRPVMHGASVALVIEEPVPDLTLCTDEGKIAQVVRNFIANAVKFTERGEIRVTTSVNDRDEVTFAVSDTGVGISAANQALIFQDFVQVDNPRQQYVKGTGLGLSLSRKIAELLAGSIGVTSELDVGSTFWITVPRLHPHASADCIETTVDASLSNAPDAPSRG